MADIYFDVDTALTEVPVNSVPLVDATTGATIQGAVTYNQAGLALFWHFITTTGVYNNGVAVTPTNTGGAFDWVDHGTHGVYTIEMPATDAGSFKNDTEGFGWFTGFATGILPWRSFVYGFRPAAVNKALCLGSEYLRTHPGEFSVSGTTFSAKKTDGTTEQFSQTLAKTANADPVTGLAPT
jgi:hypothetical protein